MKVFVLNSGSSSLKYQLFNMPEEKPLCSGLVDRIGLNNSAIHHKVFYEDQEKILDYTADLPDHEAALQEVANLLMDKETGLISDPQEIVVVGHRVVHGGESFSATMVINNEVKSEIKRLFPLAPLHNPANYKGILIAEKIFSRAKQVAVFDTAFHQSLPENAFRFAIPSALYQEHGIRVYGFHGTSHKYVSERAIKFLKNPQAKIITIHLGNGCSMAAVKGGKSIDTSMGFGPNSGLVMGTRSGDIDSSVIFHLMENLDMSPEEIKTILNKKSGMVGLSGFSDMRDISSAIENGDEQAALAYEIYAYRIKKYIGAFSAVLNGLDALVFTAGVGENDAYLRECVCRDMEFLGIKLDEQKNKDQSKDMREISDLDGRVKVLVIPTNEEYEIARQCYSLVGHKF